MNHCTHCGIFRRRAVIAAVVVLLAVLATVFFLKGLPAVDMQCKECPLHTDGVAEVPKPDAEKPKDEIGALEVVGAADAGVATTGTAPLLDPLGLGELPQQAETVPTPEIRPVPQSPAIGARDAQPVDPLSIKKQGTASSTSAPVPAPRTVDLSHELLPLQKLDLPNAKLAVENLTKLAASQSGGAKVKTERLATVIKNLFTAEYQVEDAVKAGLKSGVEARNQERNAQQWMRPNVWGRVNISAARQAVAKANDIRNKAAQRTADARQNLVGQLRETDSVTDDFGKNQEFEVALVLAGMCEAVAARSLPGNLSSAFFQENTVAKIRKSIQSGRLENAGPAN